VNHVNVNGISTLNVCVIAKCKLANTYSWQRIALLCCWYVADMLRRYRRI